MPPGKLVASSTVLLVEDIYKATNYYCDRLGFTNAGFTGQQSDAAILRRDDQRIILKQVVYPRQSAPVWTIADTLFDVIFWVDDIDACYGDMLRLGADIRYPPRNHAEGFRAFVVFDVDDHAIAFGQMLSDV